VTSSVRKAALTVLAQLSAKNPTAVIPSLESLIACLLKALDPRDANRTQALKEVSATLRIVLKHFPMTAYHKATNRLAVGYVDHTIVLYDLTTTSKLRVFKGHEGRPSCLCFNPEGDHLASYSAQECSARVWAVGGTGVISGLLRSQGKCVNQFALPKIAAPAVEGSLSSFMRSGKADTGGVDTLSCAMLWNLPGILRLKREDGSNVTLSVQV
jgi:WD40 repeat protein